MRSPNLWPKYSWHSCGREPAFYHAMVVLDSVVEEPEDVFSVGISCQDGETVGVPFRSFHQRLVFVADSHSCGGSWDVNELVFQVTIITK